MTVHLFEQKLKNILKSILGSAHAQSRGAVSAFCNSDLSFGDYGSNILFLIAKEKKISPQDAYYLIATYLEKIPEIASSSFKNGFLNVTLHERIFFQDIKTIIRTPKAYLCSDIGRGKKIIIEFVSANPTGPLTLGNARAAVLGDALSKILSFSGFRVTREYYVNDRGVQTEMLAKSTKAALGIIDEEEAFYKGAYVKDLSLTYAEKIKKTDDNAALGKYLADIILESYIKQHLKAFGTQYDKFFFETELYRSNLSKKVMAHLEKKNLVLKKDGAVWIALTSIGDPKDEVIIKSNGEFTYFWSDILYHYDKVFIRKSAVLNLLGADHLDHARRLKSVFEKIFSVSPHDFRFIVYQMVNLVKNGEIMRMSKRKGNFITLDELLSETGIDPIRFFFLKYSPDSTVEFDMNVAKKDSQENPIWYIHYASVRMRKILEKAAALHHLTLSPRSDLAKAFHPLIKNELYAPLIRRIHQLPDLVTGIARDLHAHALPQWFYEFSKQVHAFYEKEHVVPDIIADEEQKNLIKQKLIFVQALHNILLLGIDLLGLTAKQKL